jgi:hypothetical protein
MEYDCMFLLPVKTIFPWLALDGVIFKETEVMKNCVQKKLTNFI